MNISVENLRNQVANGLGIDLKQEEFMPFSDGDLALIEEQFRTDTAQYLGLSRRSSWEVITDAYLERIDTELRNRTNDIDKRSFLVEELSRFQLAKMLQLNKFTASFGEIFTEIQRLGINLEL